MGSRKESRPGRLTTEIVEALASRGVKVCPSLLNRIRTLCVAEMSFSKNTIVDGRKESLALAIAVLSKDRETAVKIASKILPAEVKRELQEKT